MCPRQPRLRIRTAWGKLLPHIVPPNPKMPRDYAKEYMTYRGKQEHIKRRDARSKSRALMEKNGLVRKGGGLHVDHKNNNPLDNRPSNLRAVAANTNLQIKNKKKA